MAAVGGDAGWPISWYWRATPTFWSDPTGGMRPPLVFCDPDKEGEVRRRLGPGYVAERLPLRAWWLMEGRRPTVGEVIRYVFTREPWGDIGSTDTILLRHTGEAPEAARAAETPEILVKELAVGGARIVGEGWLAEPRGLAVSPAGVLAVADVALSDVVFFDADGRRLDISVPETLNEPEAVAWTADGVLAIADTWNHRVLLFNTESGAVRPLPEPEGGWYGPRAVAVAGDGTLVVADTGNKRLVLVSFRGGESRMEIVGGESAADAGLVEPVGLVWLDDRRILVCDTGNHRLRVLDRSGRVLETVELTGAWSDFYSRPQVALLGPRRWLMTDSPARALWLADEGRVRRIGLENGEIVPSGVALGSSTLYVADTGSRVWAFDLLPE